MGTARAMVDQHFPQSWCCPWDGGPGVGGPAPHPQPPVLLTAWRLPAQVVLRVLFPDRHILQGFFRPRETGKWPRLGVQEGGVPPSGCGTCLRAPGKSSSQVAVVPGEPAAGTSQWRTGAGLAHVGGLPGQPGGVCGTGCPPHPPGPSREG